MMNALVVIGHPDPSSLAHAAAAEATHAFKRHGAAVAVHDLYEEHFDLALSREEIARRYSFDPLVQRHAEELAKATHLVVAHPQWWGLPPAVVKGWVDRVFLTGIAFDYEGEEFLAKHRVPLLRDLEVIIISSTDTSPSTLPPPETLTERFWRDEVFAFCGGNLRFHTLGRVRETSYREREGWIRRISDLVDETVRSTSHTSESTASRIAASRRETTERAPSRPADASAQDEA
jgi:NAD(P)H dehydrogenase (quinone)